MLVTDLDGTLLDMAGRVSPADEQALQAARRAGVGVVLATGRAFATALPVARRLALPTPMVVYNGARLMDPDGRVLWERWLSGPAVELAVGLARRFGLSGFAYLPRRLVPLLGGERLLPYLLPEDQAMVGEAMVGAGPARLERPGEGPGAAIKLLFLGERQACDQFQAALQQHPRLARPVRSGEHCVEVLAPGVSKAAALARLLASWGVHPSQVVAVGDGLNDLEMLRLVGRPVAVASAEEPVRALACWVAPAPEQGPMAAVLQRFFPQVPLPRPPVNGLRPA
ncbi:MAG TPA: HAD-IIB family hydrolase [Limnochordales bacterium]